MKDITHEKILEALNIIKQTCVENKCNNCPFHTENKCMIAYYTPNTWEIKERTIWRAFKEKD